MLVLNDPPSLLKSWVRVLNRGVVYSAMVVAFLICPLLLYEEAVCIELLCIRIVATCVNLFFPSVVRVCGRLYRDLLLSIVFLSVFLLPGLLLGSSPRNKKHPVVLMQTSTRTTTISSGRLSLIVCVFFIDCGK